MKQKKTVKNNKNIFIIFLGMFVIVVSVFIGFTIGERKKVGNDNKIVFMDGEGKTLSVNKPSFLETASMNSNVIAESKESIFDMFTEGATEPRFALCETQYGEYQEGSINDCVWEKYEYNGNSINVVYKDGKIKKAATILLNLKNLNYGVQIDKRSKETRKPDFFTDEEIKMWIEEIKKW